ncbi:hypothetical protein ACFQ51_50200 [Streptomyces kaempferi]
MQRHQRVGGAAFDEDERGQQGEGGGGRGEDVGREAAPWSWMLTMA